MNGDMTIKKVERRLCPCCMEVHDVRTIAGREASVYKEIPVEFDVEYYNCDLADETYAYEQQLSANYASMKNAYQEKMKIKEERRQ